MGQYYIIVNVDKNEYINPHSFDDGAKLGEQNKSIQMLRILIGVRQQSINKEWSVIIDGKENLFVPYLLPGSWAGNKIVFAGDYNDYELYNEIINENINNINNKYTDICDYLYRLYDVIFDEVSHYHFYEKCTSIVYYNLDKKEYYEYVKDEESYSNDDLILYALSDKSSWYGDRISLNICKSEKEHFTNVKIYNAD